MSAHLNHNKDNKHRSLFAGLVLMFSVCIFFVGSVMNSNESNLVIWIFAVPIGIQVIGCMALYIKDLEGGNRDNFKLFYRVYLGVMFFCSLSQCGLWIIYLLKNEMQNESLESWSHYSLYSIIVLVSCVIIMTLAIMRKEDGLDLAGADEQNWLTKTWNEILSRTLSQLDNLKQGAAEEAFLAVLLFFNLKRV